MILVVITESWNRKFWIPIMDNMFPQWHNIRASTITIYNNAARKQHNNATTHDCPYLIFSFCHGFQVYISYTEDNIVNVAEIIERWMCPHLFYTMSWCCTGCSIMSLMKRNSSNVWKLVLYTNHLLNQHILKACDSTSTPIAIHWHYENSMFPLHYWSSWQKRPYLGGQKQPPETTISHNINCV